MKTTTRHLRQLKDQRPIVALTAYDALFARLADEAGADLLLVGDSVGNTFLGFESTVPVTVEMMLHHTSAVARAQPQALIVADLPFEVIHRERDFVLETACRFIRAGAEAVKVEGGASIADKVQCLTAAGVPVLGHVGLLPQQVLQLGGYRKFGKAPEEQEQLLADVSALEKAGAFAIIGEMIAAETAGRLRAALRVPFIGIGCGKNCDGQILVCNDVLGLGTGTYPSFSHQYAQLADAAREAFQAYAKDVRQQCFP